MTTTTAPDVLRVRPHEVERGDVLVGSTRPVETLLFHGNEWRWCAYDVNGVLIRVLPPQWDVQVIRRRPSNDWAPPYGILRPIEALS